MAKVKKKEALSLEKMIVSIDEQPYEVPENWCWIRLLDAFDNLTDSKKKLATKEYLEEGLYPIVDQGQAFIGGYTDAEGMLYEGELPVVVFGDHTRYMKYIDFSFVQGADGVKVLRPKKFWDSKAFYYAFKSIDIPNLGYRRHYPLFKDFCIPVPPLAEQQRIVEQIESLFAKLDEVKEKTLEALESFNNRRAAILNKAFRGELTSEWRRKNGVDLSSWSNKPFKEFCLLKRGFDLPTQERIRGKYPLVTSSGVNDYISDYKVNGPGVITGRSGTIGKVFLVEDDYWPLNTTLYSEEIYDNDPEYVFYFLQTFDFKQYSSSTAVPTLNRNLFADVMIKVPSKDEQIQIVKKIKVLLDSEEHIKDLLTTVISKIELMKKTVLAKAFRGELGTNNPEEEAATELLKAILSQE